MKGLFKRLSILAASLAMVFGVGLVNNEKKNAKAIGESTYVKVTEAPTDWTGEYVLVYENSATEAYVWTGADATNCYEKATIAESKITLSPTAKLNIASMDGGYSIQINGGTNNGKYVGQASNSNGMKIQPTALANTLSITSNSATIVSGGAYMRFNASKDQMRFRYYKSASYTNQKTVQLYKLDESSIEKEVDSVEVTLKTSSTAYVDNSLTEDDIEVYVLYADATGEVIKNGYSINPELPYTFSSSDVGEITFIVTYKDVTASFTITVKEKPTDLVLSEIKITEGENVKKTYYVGDSVDTTGLTVTAGYLSASDPSHESYVDVTDKVTWSLDTSAINAEAHLTATYIEGEITETTYIVVIVKEGLSNEYALVTNVNDLSENDMIVIAAQSAEVAIGSTQDKNNRPVSTITKSENSITASKDTQRIILKKGTKDNTFALSVEDGFLYAASSSNNYLKTESTLSNNSSWSITITSTGVATIKAQGTNSRNTLQYNKSAKIFSCYSSSQEAVVIYKYYASADAKNLVKAIEDADTCTDYVNVNTYLSSYDNLSSEEKIFVDRSFISDVSLDGKTVELTCRTKLDFMSARYAAQQGSSNAKFNLYSSSTANVSFVLIIGVIGLGSILGYYFINKKRMLSK